MAKLENSVTAITGLPRGEIRYALYRVKNENAEPVHEAIYNYYKPRLTKMGMTAEDFAVRWDIKKDNTEAIVAGAMVSVYNEEIHASLFTEDGALKEF